MLEECVAGSNLIFESAKEDIEVKTEITENVDKAIQPHAISETGFSGLSITTIA